MSLQCFPLENKEIFRENDPSASWFHQNWPKIIWEALFTNGKAYLNSGHFRAKSMFTHFVFIHTTHLECVISSSRNVGSEVQLEKVWSHQLASSRIGTYLPDNICFNDSLEKPTPSAKASVVPASSIYVCSELVIICPNWCITWERIPLKYRIVFSLA